MPANTFSLGFRETRLLVFGLVAISIVLPLMTLIVPQAKKLKKATTAVSALESVSFDGDKLTDALADAERANDDLRFQLYGDMAGMPANQIEAFVIGRLQEISWAADVELRSVEPAAGELVQIFEESLFRIEIVGQYENLYDWLWKVRHELGYVVVKHYDLRRVDNEDEDPELLAKLSLASYRAVLR